nr:hypothetical protein [Tanacetum cinerariifolium]
MHQLVNECCVEVPEQQKQKMEATMFDLVKICHIKQFLCIRDDIDDLIESALDSKLLSINSINSQCLDKKEQEVKNVEEQPAERRNRAEKSLQNFREPEHLLSMGYEHPSITPETESDEVTESNAENLLPIPSKCEVTLEDEIECDMPAKDVYVPAEEFKIYSNPLCDEDEINSDKLDPHCFNVKSDFVESLLNRDTFIDFSSKFDFSEELNEEIADTIIESIPLLPIPIQDGNSQQEEIDIGTETDDVLPPKNPSISRPPPEPPDDNFDLEPEVISAVMEDIDEPDKHFNPGGEIFVSTNNEDVDYFPSMFVILIFLPYLILPEISPLLLSAESEDTIFNLGISE